MTAMSPVYDEVLSYLNQIRAYLDAIEQSLLRLPKERDDGPNRR